MVGCYQIFGDNDFAARLPSVLAAAGISVLLFLWASGIQSSLRLALLAAALFGLCLQSFMHGKAAVADMVMIFFMTAAFWTGWSLVDRLHTRAWQQFVLWAIFAICLGLGFLTKGPIAWLPLLPLLAMGVVLKRGWVFQLCGLASLAAAAGIVLIWASPALKMTGGEYFDVGIGKHVVDRSLKVMEGHGAGNALGYIALLPLYFVTVFISFFPGSLLLPAHIKAVWGRRIDPLSLYLCLQVLLIFVVFSLVSTKLPHYTLPAFPALALWVTMTVGNLKKLQRRYSNAAKWTTLVLVALSLFVFPQVAKLIPSHEFAARTKDLLDPKTGFASVEYVEPSLVWYMRKHVDGFHLKRKPEQAAEYINRDGFRVLVVPTAMVPQLGDLSDMEQFQMGGLNIAKGEWLELTMIIKDD